MIITTENMKRLEILADNMHMTVNDVLNSLIESNYKTLMADALLSDTIHLNDKDGGIRVSETFHNEVLKIKEKTGLSMYKVIILLLKRIELREDIKEVNNSYTYGDRCKIIRTSRELVIPVKKLSKERGYSCMGIMLEHAYNKGLFEL